MYHTHFRFSLHTFRFFIGLCMCLCFAPFLFGQSKQTEQTFITEIMPSLFLPGIVSDGFSNRDLAISPDGHELFYTIMHRGGVYSCLMTSKKKGNQWSIPEIVSFSGLFNDLEPSFSHDGKRLYFSSNRPLTDTGKRKDYDIWYVDKMSQDSWGNPVNIGYPVNSNQNEFYPSVAKNGNLYFTRILQNEFGEDIVMCEKTTNGYLDPIRLSNAINSNGDEFNAFVSSTETFIIFSASGRKDDLGGGDLYISFKEGKAWEKALRLPLGINSKFLDYCPFVSADGATLYFTSNRSNINTPFAVKPIDIKKILASPQNGFDDIYEYSFTNLMHLLKR